MKYILFFTLVLSLLGTLIVQGCMALNKNLSAGENVHGSNESDLSKEQDGYDKLYEGTGRGYRGPITVQVRMNGADITEITVIDSEEDRFVGSEAVEELIDLVIMYNSTDLDVISGATETSKGFLEAVDNAIMKK